MCSLVRQSQMECSPTVRNPLGLSCSSRSITTSDPSYFYLRGGSEPLLPHNLAASRLSETNCSYRCSDEASEPGSSACTTATSSPRHISLAKGLLNEAHAYFANADGDYFGLADGAPPASALPPQLAHAAQEHKGRRRSQDSNLGPLMALLEETQDPVKAICCLKALSFLLLDQENRRDLHQICGLDILLDVLQRYQQRSGAIASAASAGACAAGASAHAVQAAVLSAVASLVSHDDDAKVYLWSRDGSGAILDLLSPRLPPPQLLEILDLVARLSFSGPRNGGGGSRKHSGSSSSGSCRRSSGRAPAGQVLLEPRFVAATSRLLHPTADREVLHQTLSLLNAAAVARSPPPASKAPPASPPSWHAPLFLLVPLLVQEQQQQEPAAFGCATSGGPSGVCTPLAASRRSSFASSAGSAAATAAAARASWAEGCSVLEAALKLLLNLSDQPQLRGALYAAGCIAPLLPLLSHASASVRVSTACTLANLVEHDLSRRQLSQERELSFLVDLLRTVQCSEVAVGLVYVLGRLVSLGSRTLQVGRRMHRLGAPALLQRRVDACGEDQDLVLGALQLLQLLGSSDESAAAHCAGGPRPAREAHLRTSRTAASF